jgi:RNA polymerase sigma-70 factor (ECF subfamily)
LNGAVAGDARDKLSRELQQIFEQHAELVYRTAFALTGSKADAEDILQTLFMRLLACEVSPDLSRTPERYLYRAAFNLSLNYLRDRKREVLTGDIEAVDDRTVSGPMTVDEMFDRRLQKAISELNPAAAQMLILRYVHDYSLADIATMLGTTRSTVAVSLFRSRARLKKDLAGE